MKQPKRPKRNKPTGRFHPVYRQFWRLVDGAVRDAFSMHPDYIAPGRLEKTVRNSITKRVVGALLGYVGVSRKRRHGADPGDPSLPGG